MNQSVNKQPTVRDSTLVGLSIVLRGNCAAIMTNSAKCAYEARRKTKTYCFCAE